MQPIVNMSSKKRRCRLKSAFARVTKLRIMAALLVATVVIGMPFSVQAFVATSQTNNDTHVIINEGIPTTSLPHQRSFLRTQYRKAIGSLLRNQESIVQKLDGLAREISFMKDNLALRRFQAGHDYEFRGTHHHKPFNENAKTREGNKVMQPLEEISEKLTALLHLQGRHNLDSSYKHKSFNTPTSRTYPRNEPRSRNRRSSPYAPDTFAFSTPVFNTHIPSLNMEAGYIESNHINPNPQSSYAEVYGPRFTRVQPSVNSDSSLTSAYSDNSVYDDPQPMYGPLYDRNPTLYKTTYADAPLPSASYQEPALRYDSLLDGQQTSTTFGSAVRDSSYYTPQLGQSSNSESDESSRNVAYTEAHTDEAQRPSHGMKSMLQELLSLVRWLVRKKHQNQSSQNNYITSVQHSLNQRLTSVEGSIIEAMTAQTQDILQSAHQMGHEIRLETANSNSHNLSKIVLEAISNTTPVLEAKAFEKCLKVLSNELRTKSLSNLEHAGNEITEQDTEAAYSNGENDVQVSNAASDNNKNAYYLSDVNQENNVSALHNYDDIRLHENKKTPIWEVFSLADFLSDPVYESSLDLEPSAREHPEISERSYNSTTNSLIEAPNSVFDSKNGTDEERFGISLESLSSRSATQAAHILVLASELLKNVSSTHQSRRQDQSGPPCISCISVNQTELVRSFTDEFQAFLDELKTKLGHSLSQNLAEDSLELVLSRLLAPSVQRLEDRMLGVQIYLDAAVLKLRHEFEAAITTSESSLNASLSASVTSIVRKAVDEAMLTARETALQIADATVTSVSSAAVASGHHSNEVLTNVIKRSATQVKNAIRQGVGGCPQHFTSLGGLCLKVPSIAPPVPFAPVHYSPAFTPTSDAPPATSYNWTQARAICRSYEGDLAVVPEFQDLTKIFRSLNTGSEEGFWLGAKRKTVTEGETLDPSEARVKLKWITGEFSEFDSQLKQKMLFKSPVVTASQNDVRNDVYANYADAATGVSYPDMPECLLLRTDHSLSLEVADCGALHKPLCQFIPTL